MYIFLNKLTVSKISFRSSLNLELHLVELYRFKREIMALWQKLRNKYERKIRRSAKSILQCRNLQFSAKKRFGIFETHRNKMKYCQKIAKN